MGAKATTATKAAIVLCAVLVVRAAAIASDKYRANPGGDIDITPLASGLKQVPDGIVLANGQSRAVAGVEVEAIAAYDIKPGPPEHPEGEANGSLKNIDAALMPMNIPSERMSPAAAAECTKAIRPAVVYVYHYDQDAAARAANPMARQPGLPAGLTVAQSVDAFREAMKGTRIESDAPSGTHKNEHNTFDSASRISPGAAGARSRRSSARPGSARDVQRLAQRHAERA